MKTKLYATAAAVALCAGAVHAENHLSGVEITVSGTWLNPEAEIVNEIFDMFEEQTGHTVEVTKSNNEEMIAKLRATGGAGFDLAQPSHDRIYAAQLEYDIYKPLDLSKINTDAMQAKLLRVLQDGKFERLGSPSAAERDTAIARLTLVGERAVAAWRDALVWLNAAGSDVGLFRDYLAEVGED